MTNRRVLACDAVLFDLDGVLVDSSVAVERHYRAFADRHGIDADALVDSVPGRRMADILATAVPSLQGGRLRDECARFEAAEADDLDDMRVMARAKELLQELEGCAWAVVTSGTAPVARARLAAAGLPVPSVLITGDLVARGKPDPEAYLRAAEELGVEPGRCVIVEDAPAGVAAGRAAGATVVGVATTVPVAALAAADHVVMELAHLSASRMNGGSVALHLESPLR